MALYGIKRPELNQDQSEPMAVDVDVDVNVAVGAVNPPLGSEPMEIDVDLVDVPNLAVPQSISQPQYKLSSVLMSIAIKLTRSETS